MNVLFVQYTMLHIDKSNKWIFVNIHANCLTYVLMGVSVWGFHYAVNKQTKCDDLGTEIYILLHNSEN